VLHAVPGVGIVAGETGESATPSRASVAAQQTETPTNNTTVQQENPEEVDEPGDTDALRSYLSRQLAERLTESSVQISQGEYDQGQSVLGDEYDELLEKYVDVQGETGDDTASESFQQAAQQQRNYSNTVAEYNETYQEYREAKDAGNTARARELARELDRLQNQVNSSGAALRGSYDAIENTTNRNLTAAERNVENTTREVSKTHETVITETFVETNLTVSTAATSVSFDQPAVINGRLVSENGTALANETVEIRVGGRLRTVRTDSTGAFRIEYRPTTVAAGMVSMEVAYLPAARSVYLGSSESLSLDIEQTTANVSIDDAPAVAAFGDDVTVSGRALVNGTPVPGVKVRVSLAGGVVGTTTTGSDGTYQLSTSLPASVQAGEGRIQTRIVPDGAAVRSEPTTTPIRIERTSTSLSLQVEQTPEGLRITGQLATADGAELGGQPVELRIENTTVTIVDTGTDGTFERVIAPAESLEGTVTLRAVYDEPGTNLGSAVATEQVELTRETDRESAPVSPRLLGGGGIIVVSLAAIAWLVRRSGSDQPASAPPTTTASTPTTGESEPAGESALQQASSLLADGDPDPAVRALYRAVRQSIDSGSRAGTHWEFYTAVSDQLSPESASTLERLTEAYERVVYSPDPVDAETADSLLEEAEGLLGEPEEEV